MSPHCVRHLNSLEHNLPSRGVTKVQTFPQYARGYRRNLYRYYPLRSKTDSGGFKIRSKAKSFLVFLPFLRETNTCRARMELSRRNKGNKGNLCSDARSLSAISAISAGHYYLMRIELLLSRSHRLCRFARRRNKGKNGNLYSALRGALSAISAISAGHYYLMRIVLLLSRRNKGNNGNSLTRPMRSLSAISAISAGHYYLMRVELLLSRSHRLCRFARRRNKGNKGNSLTRPMRSSFCTFCHFCGTFSISCG